MRRQLKGKIKTVYDFIKQQTDLGNLVSDTDIVKGLKYKRAICCNYRVLLKNLGYVKFAGLSGNGIKLWSATPDNGTEEAEVELMETKTKSAKPRGIEQDMSNLVKALNSSLNVIMHLINKLPLEVEKPVETKRELKQEELALPQ